MKKQFLESKFGKELVSMITEWDQALEKRPFLNSFLKVVFVFYTKKFCVLCAKQQ